MAGILNVVDPDLQEFGLWWADMRMTGKWGGGVRNMMVKNKQCRAYTYTCY